MKQSSAERPDLRRPRATRDQLLRASRTAGPRAVIKSSSHHWQSRLRPSRHAAVPVYLCSAALGANARFCRRQGLPGCRGAGILVRRACCRSPVAAGGEADRGSRREGERELRPGGRRDPRTPRRLGFWPGAWRPRAIRGTHASPDHPADGGSETSRRSRPVRSLVAAAQEGAAAWRVRTLPCRHVE